MESYIMAIKSSRIANAVAGGIVTAAAIAAVVMTWRANGADVSSIIVGALFYGVTIGGSTVVVDTYLKEHAR